MIKEIYDLVETARGMKTELDSAYQKAVKVCEKIESLGGVVIGEHRDGFLMYEVKRLSGPPRTTPEGVQIIEKREGVFGWLPTFVKKAEPLHSDLFEELRILDFEIFRVRTPQLSNLQKQATDIFGQWFLAQITREEVEK